MIKSSNLPNAYKEVFEILKYVNKDELNLISKEFIDMIQKNMNNDYEYKYDESKEFENQNLLRETKVIFAYIYLNFWANPEEKKRIQLKFKNDIRQAEKIKKEKYNVNNLFAERNNKKDDINNNKNNEMATIMHKDTFINKIKKLLKRILKKN
ncbi:MAG: hypothetical protein J6A89_03435 [Clostridia bacterium]|nr:hypothetical protein [Clostridia bacterium]